jgi:hypothetical protein
MHWLNALKRVPACLVIGLAALAMPQARAEVRGKVYMLANPEASRLEWRRAPLPGAYVAVYWYITLPGPGHATTTCGYSEFARSDDKGEYRMEGPNFVTAGLAHASFLVYSPGLELINFPYGGSALSEKDITMAKSTLDPGERLSRIFGFAHPGCPGRKLDDPRGLLEGFHRNLLDEARSLRVETDLARTQYEGIEAAARRASGLDKPGPLRAVIKPSPAPIESGSPIPEPRP